MQSFGWSLFRYQITSKSIIKFHQKMSVDFTTRKQTDNRRPVCKSEELINSLNSVESDNDWMIDQTEKFCKDKAVYNAIMQSIQIIDGQDKRYSVDSLPSILSDAGVGFDNHVGHDYIDDASCDSTSITEKKKTPIRSGLLQQNH